MNKLLLSLSLAIGVLVGEAVAMTKRSNRMFDVLNQQPANGNGPAIDVNDDCFQECETINEVLAKDEAQRYHGLLQKAVLLAINDEKSEHPLVLSPLVCSFWLTLCDNLSQEVNVRRAADFEAAMTARLQELLFELVMQNDGGLKVSHIAEAMPAGLDRDFMVAVEVMEQLITCLGTQASRGLANHGQAASPSRA